MTTLKKLLLIWIAVIVLILIAARFIVTDSKRVNRVLQATEAAIRSADADGLVAHVASDYEYQGLTREALQQHARAIFRRGQFPTTIMRNKSIQVAEGVGNVKFTVFAQPAQGSPYPPSNTAWRLKLQKRDGRWWITEIELLTVDGHAMGDLKQVMELAEGMGGGK